jgi:hypothetical protein
MRNCASGNLEIPGSCYRTPRNDETFFYFFKCFAKNSRLRGQAISELALS